MNELVPMAGNPEGSFEIEYRPLFLSDRPQEYDLSIVSRDLGIFKYKLRLTTSPPALRQTLRFEVPLGAVQTESFVFRAYLPTKSEFTCSTKGGSSSATGQPEKVMFTTQKTISVEAGTLVDTNKDNHSYTHSPKYASHSRISSPYFQYHSA